MILTPVDKEKKINFEHLVLVNIIAKGSQRPKSYYVLFFIKLIGRIPTHPPHVLPTPAPTYTQHIHNTH